MHNPLYCIVGTCCLLILSSCSRDKIYTLKELSNNFDNQLKLAITAHADFKAINKKYEKKTTEEIKALLTEPNISFVTASYGLYYLGFNHIQHKKEAKVREGIKYLHVAADQYYNPFAMSTLGRMYYTSTEGLPEGIEQNVILAYYYTNLAIALGNITAEKSKKGQYVLDYVSRNSLGLFDALNTQLVQVRYDVPKAEAKLKNHLEKIKKAYTQNYLSH